MGGHRGHWGIAEESLGGHWGVTEVVICGDTGVMMVLVVIGDVSGGPLRRQWGTTAEISGRQ